VGECLGPNINFTVVGFGFGLPFVYRRDLAIHRDRREAGNAQLLAPFGRALDAGVIVRSSSPPAFLEARAVAGIGTDAAAATATA